MYKKGLALFFVLLMVVGMFGCGSKKSSGDDSSSEVSPIDLKFAHADNETSVFHQGALAFKEKLEELSDGSVTVTIYPSGQLGSISDAAKGVQMGTVDVAPVSATVLANFAPSIGVYDMPFLIENYQHAYKSLDGEVGNILSKELEENGMLCKGWWTLGYRNVTTSKDVQSIDDLAGLKIRTQSSPVHIEIFKALGVDPTPMDFGELYTALQQKTVDGQENPYINILQANIYDVNDTIVETEHVFQVAGLLVSPKTWEKLTPEQQGYLEEATAYATEVERKACENDNEAAKEKLTTELGMKLVTLDKSELQIKTAPVYDNHPELADLVEKVRSYK